MKLQKFHTPLIIFYHLNKNSIFVINIFSIISKLLINKIKFKKSIEKNSKNKEKNNWKMLFKI